MSEPSPSLSQSVLLAGSVGAKAELQDIAVTGLHADFSRPANDTAGNVEVSWVLTWCREGSDVLIYDSAFTAADTVAKVLEVRLTLEARYRVGDLEGYSSEHLDAFGQVSVLFTLWPYVRELLQSLTVRAGLPPLVLHTLRTPIDPPLELEPAGDGEGLSAGGGQ